MKRFIIGALVGCTICHFNVVGKISHSINQIDKDYEISLIQEEINWAIETDNYATVAKLVKQRKELRGY